MEIKCYTRNDGKVRYRVVDAKGRVLGENLWTLESAKRFRRDCERLSRGLAR